MNMICAHCRRWNLDARLKWDEQIGMWVHVNGGGVIMQKCEACGWQGNSTPPKSICPRCKTKTLRDHHFAQAIPEKVESL